MKYITTLSFLIITVLSNATSFRLNPTGIFSISPSSMGSAGVGALFWPSLDNLGKSPLALKEKEKSIAVYGAGTFIRYPVRGKLTNRSYFIPYGGSLALKIKSDVRLGASGTFYQMATAALFPLRAEEYSLSLLVGNQLYFGFSAGLSFYKDKAIDKTGTSWRYTMTFGTESKHSAFNFLFRFPSSINWNNHPLASLQELSGLISLTYEGRPSDKINALFSVSYIAPSRTSSKTSVTAIRYKDEWRFASSIHYALLKELTIKIGLSTARLHESETSASLSKLSIISSFGFRWNLKKPLGITLDAGYFDTGLFPKKKEDETYALYGVSIEADWGKK